MPFSNSSPVRAHSANCLAHVAGNAGGRFMNTETRGGVTLDLTFAII